MCLGVPGEILEVIPDPDDGDNPLGRTGRVAFGGVVREVSLAGLPDARVGDWVIVHAGFALNTLDESEAMEVFDYLRQMTRLADEEGVDSGAEAAGGPRARPE